MSNKYEAKAIYDEMIHDVTTSEKKWSCIEAKVPECKIRTHCTLDTL